MNIRVDYLKDEVVMYAKSRGDRPNNYTSAGNEVVNKDVVCPFCAENTHMTKEIIYKNNRTGIRIIKNLYPAVEDNFGVHDVVIEAYDHDMKFKDFSEDFVYDFLTTIKYRYEELAKKEGIKCIQIFKNSGRNSGASLEHAHWQILATNFVPTKNLLMSEKFETYVKENGVCYHCSQKDLYKIMEDDNVVMGIPYASSSSATFRIIPKKHYSSFSELSKETLSSVSKMLLKSIQLLDDLEKDFSYNVLFFSKPVQSQNENFHFFIEVVGRKGRYGGFELSTGAFISSFLPEDIYEKINLMLEV